MAITKTYTYKLYRAKRNQHLHQQIDVAGIIWNHCMALHKRYYRRYKQHLHVYQLQKHIAKLKHQPKYACWSLIGSQAIQDICQRIDRAYRRFFQDLNTG